MKSHVVPFRWNKEITKDASRESGSTMSKAWKPAWAPLSMLCALVQGCFWMEKECRVQPHMHMRCGLAGAQSGVGAGIWGMCLWKLNAGYVQFSTNRLLIHGEGKTFMSLAMLDPSVFWHNKPVILILIGDVLPHNSQDWGGGKISDTHSLKNTLLKWVFFKVVLLLPSSYSNFAIP